MTWYDWLILVLPVCFVMYMGFYSRRYVRGVSDFLSAGRLCGRYVISMGDVANSLSIIGLVGYIEMRYKTGFSVGFWSSSSRRCGSCWGSRGTSPTASARRAR